MTETLAIIPARGGSKGIPRKNVLPLCGKPLIAWTIEAALAAETVDRVVVSTDDAEIAAVSRNWGAEIIERPVAISGDRASSEAALTDALDQLAEREGYRPELMVFLQCTSPLTIADDIDGTVNCLLRGGADTALAVADFHYFVWKRDEHGEAVGVNHDKRVRLLRQQREPEYLETGAVYAMRVAGFREAQHRFFGKTALHVIPAERRLEIDDPPDFDVAEMRLAERLRSDRRAALPRRTSAVVMDFDGVLTNNNVLVTEDGVEAVSCSRSDGMGLEMLRKRGVRLLVLSKERNPVVAARCRKLKVECRHGIEKKLPELRAWLTDQKIEASNTIYVGNDVNDLECLAAAGLRRGRC